MLRGSALSLPETPPQPDPTSQAQKRQMTVNEPSQPRQLGAARTANSSPANASTPTKLTRQRTKSFSVVMLQQPSQTQLSKKGATKVQCKFFKTGKCNAGDSCTFLHASESPAKLMSLKGMSLSQLQAPFEQQQQQSSAEGICKFYAKGNCRFGAKCSSSHVVMSSNDAYPAVSTNQLPSPDSIRHPAVPLPIRHKSMPDIFRWSADDKNPYPSSNFLFYSSSVREEDESPYLLSETTRTSRSQSVSEVSLKKKDGYATPDPFSPFPEDFSEDEPTFLMDADDKGLSDQLCQFAVIGKCRFGEKCRDLHGAQCKFCKLFVLHPFQSELNKEHVAACELKHKQMEKLIGKSKNIVCRICSDKVADNGKFALMSCDHPFCLSCIRTLRANRVSAGQKPRAILACPVCNIPSPFITPSTFWITTSEEKTMIVGSYKEKIRSIPCKYFNYGVASCPFGSGCCYAHLNVPGLSVISETSHRIVASEEDLRVLKNVCLSDFLEETECKQKNKI